MSDNKTFESLHDLKIDMQYLLEERGYTYHGGSLLGDKMEAILYVSLCGKEYKIVVTVDDSNGGE